MNDYVLTKYVAGSKDWSFIASTSFETIKKGDNIFNVYFQKKDSKDKILLDSITINYDPNIQKDEASMGSSSKIDTSSGSGSNIPLQLLIPDSSPNIYNLASILEKHFKESGVNIEIISADPVGFQTVVEKNEYDFVIVGQSLDRTLDFFPYFHSSQTDGKGLNLNNIASFKIDTILTDMRNPTKAIKSLSPISINEFLASKTEELKNIINESHIVYPLYQPRITYLTKPDAKIDLPIDFVPHERFFYSTSWHLNNKRVLRIHPEINIFNQFRNFIWKNLFFL